MIWLSTKEAAELLGYGERTVRKRALDKEYQNRYVPSSTGQGGRKMEILLESLPEQAQRAYHNSLGESQPVFNTDYSYTKAQREKGELRALAVTEHRKYQKEMVKNGITRKTEIMRSFVAEWNSGHPDFQITVKSLYDWIKKSKSGKVEKLADRRGGYNRGQSSIPKKYQEMFTSLYLQQTKPSLESCFRETRIQADLSGDLIPGIKAFRLLVTNMDESLLIRAREGRKAFDDKCMPYTERDYSQLAPNDWWVSDHHLWDIFVRVPDGKGGWKLARPWGSYWMDMRTRKMVSSIVRVEPPNSDIVLCSFGLGVEHFGVPKGVRLDNGRDYRASDLFVRDRYVCSDEDRDTIYRSLAVNLQIETTYAIPYNARAKPIERVFNTFEEQLGKRYPSYAGSNARQRPEDLKDLKITDVVTLEEFIVHHNRYVYEIYNEAPHSGDAMFGQSPNRLYSSLPYTVRRVTRDVLFFSLMRVKGTRTVQRNGITFNGTHFYNDECIRYIGQKVTAKYDPTKPDILYVFDRNENYLFTAEEIRRLGWDLSKEDYAKENERKKIARQKALNSYTADRVVRTTEAIGDRLKRQAESLEPSPVARPGTMEIIRNEKAEENARRISMQDIDRTYEDMLKQQKLRKQAEDERQKAFAEKFKKNMLDRACRNQA